jgi:hypothetical protein
MEARELRLNNLFYPIDRSGKVHLPYEQPFKVLTIGYEVEAIPYNKVPAQVEKWAKFKLSDLSPIPISEEWLVKFGFKREGITSSNGSLLVLHHKESVYPNGRIYWNSWCIKNEMPKYVHQLQNLYYALTNEELTIN